jgi:hypothetical protein
VTSRQAASGKGTWLRAGRLRLWRWRRNALRRRSYPVEGWIILAVGVTAFIGAPLGGVVAWDAVREARTQQREERHLTEAVLVEVAVPVAKGSTRTRAVARWTAPDGTPHSGPVPVRSHMERGARVSVWTGKDEAMTSAPLSPATARFDASVAGAAVTASLGFVSLAVHRLIRTQFERRRSAQWGREWARAAPRWNRRNA